MNAGKALYDAALVKVNAQTAASGAQQQTTLALKSAEQTARDAYQALAKVARAVFVGNDDTATLATLGLNIPTPRTAAAFLAAGYALFDNALNTPAIRTTLAGYGYPQAKLQSERAKIAALDTANQAQETAKGAAQQAHPGTGRGVEGDERVGGAIHQNCAGGVAGQEAVVGEVGGGGAHHADQGPAGGAGKEEDARRVAWQRIGSGLADSCAPRVLFCAYPCAKPIC